MILFITKKIIIILSIVLLIFLFGCTASQAYLKYPIREIDKPYTLPKSVKTWNCASEIIFSFDPRYKKTSLPFINPLYWEFGITDNFTLATDLTPIITSILIPIIRMLPLVGFKYQFINNSRFTIGTDFFGELGWGINPFTGNDFFIIGYTLDPYLRIMINRNIALKVIPGINFNHYFYPDELRTSIDYNIYCAPLFQITDKYAIELGIKSEFKEVNYNYFNLLQYYRLTPQWQINVGYMPAFNEKFNGFRFHTIYINVIYSW